MDSLVEQILTEIHTSVAQVTPTSIFEASSMIEEATRIFVAGAGRSGLCIRAAGMRLMQLGKSAYIVGETTTPSIQAGDLLILASGSGQTSTLLAITEKARSVGARILLFTTAPVSPLASMADHVVILPAPSLSSAADMNGIESIQPMGTLFEQSLLILCDSLVLRAMKNVDFTQMRERHANLE